MFLISAPGFGDEPWTRKLRQPEQCEGSPAQHTYLIKGNRPDNDISTPVNGEELIFIVGYK